ncbi:hypothetical protein DL764_001464 [Monosporascus ibericus]|uniref:Uncharacterized protein n=1 Tax=Monosporascus ibericus TaxID=155417 RepID=A0A4Q4TUL2_9PEZI|nr:hypothetical protein DL764_001464 [Monosporascus ibericus]
MYPLVFLAYAGVISAATFTIAAFAPNSEVDGALLNAMRQSFYIGTSGPATFCPSSTVPSCPDVEGTLVTGGFTAMAAMVPGGQQVYVSPNGQVKYTVAHTAFMPQGSYTDGWFNKTVVQDCGSIIEILDWLATDGSNSGGLALCPKVADFLTGTGASHSLYARTPGFNQDDCIDVMGLVQQSSNAAYGCWQYL